MQDQLFLILDEEAHIFSLKESASMGLGGEDGGQASQDGTGGTGTAKKQRRVCGKKAGRS